MVDKFSAVWVSYSSLNDFLSCPKAYYYANVYRNPRTNRKISITNPFLALGQTVHEVVESLSTLPVDKRFSESLVDKFEKSWEKVTGEKGGFISKNQEKEFKERGISMIENVTKNPGPLLNKAIKIKGEVPNYWFSEEEGIILCGKIDWLEYLEDSDSVHIIDFKTGKRDEKEDSLQLPIYYLLTEKNQSRPITKMSYWYLDRNPQPSEVFIPDIDLAQRDIMQIAKRIKLARQLNRFVCSKDEKNGCRNCAPFEAIVKGKGKFVGLSQYQKEAYILSDEDSAL